MPADEVVLSSTSDSEEEIKQALAGPEGDVEVVEEEPKGTEEPAKEKEIPEDSKESKKADESESSEEESDEEEKEETKHDQKGKGKNKVQKRIDKLTADKHKLKEQLRKAQQKLGETVAEAEEDEEVEEEEETETSETTTDASKPQPKPKRADFKSDEEYLDAIADWKIDERVAARDAKAQLDAQQKRDRETFDNFASATKDFRANLEEDDYDEVIADLDEKKVYIPTAVQAAIVESKRPDIAYYIAKHPEVAAKMMAIPVAQAVMELGMIAAKIDAENASASTGSKGKTEKPKAEAIETEKPKAEPNPVVPIKKTVPTAKAPIKPLGGGATKTSAALDDPEVDYIEYKRRREAGER